MASLGDGDLLRCPAGVEDGSPSCELVSNTGRMHVVGVERCLAHSYTF